MDGRGNWVRAEGRCRCRLEGRLPGLGAGTAGLESSGRGDWTSCDVVGDRGDGMCDFRAGRGVVSFYNLDICVHLCYDDATNATNAINGEGVSLKKQNKTDDTPTHRMLRERQAAGVC